MKDNAEMVGLGLRYEYSTQEDEKIFAMCHLFWQAGCWLWMLTSHVSILFVTKFSTFFISGSDSLFSEKEHDGQFGRGSVRWSSMTQRGDLGKKTNTKQMNKKLPHSRTWNQQTTRKMSSGTTNVSRHICFLRPGEQTSVDTCFTALCFGGVHCRRCKETLKITCVTNSFLFYQALISSADGNLCLNSTKLRDALGIKMYYEGRIPEFCSIFQKNCTVLFQIARHPLFLLLWFGF